MFARNMIAYHPLFPIKCARFCIWLIWFDNIIIPSWSCVLFKIMMTSSIGNIFRVTGHLCGEFTGLRWTPRTKASDAELWCFFIFAWMNAWVNNREAGDLRRHRAHYDVTVMPHSRGNAKNINNVDLYQAIAENNKALNVHISWDALYIVCKRIDFLHNLSLFQGTGWVFLKWF